MMAKYVYGLWALVFAVVVLAETWAFHVQYRRGYEAAKLETEWVQMKQAAGAQSRANAAAASYVAAQGDLLKQERARYERLSAIAASGVYGRDCFDADGLRELNAAIE